MKQIKGWGDQYGGGIDSKALYEVQFQVDDRQNKSFDIWVDEIQFTGCQ
jgi:hypothetical protein